MTTALTPPAIGEYWPGQGGLYAGLRRLPDGSWYHLIYADKRLPDAQWGEYGKEIEGASCRSDGLANTQALVKAGSPAAVAAHGYKAEGHVDFYLLSQQDAQLLAVNSLQTEGVIWTSTQFSADYAWAQYFSNGRAYILDKDDSFSVVPVRRLKI